MASVSAENSLGAERKPKERALSRYIVSFHDTAKSRWSEGCTGTALYASLRSSFVSREPLPSDLASSTAIQRGVQHGAELLLDCVIDTAPFW